MFVNGVQTVDSRNLGCHVGVVGARPREQAGLAHLAVSVQTAGKTAEACNQAGRLLHAIGRPSGDGAARDCRFSSTRLVLFRQH